MEFLLKDGKPLAVLRPKDPQMKMRNLEKLLRYPAHQRTQKKFDRLVTEQPHQFIGWAGSTSNKEGTQCIILNAEGEPNGYTEIGDSFVGCGPGTQLPYPNLYLLNTKPFNN